MLTVNILAAGALLVLIQAQLQPSEIIQTQDSVVFTLLDEDTRQASISFAPADPEQQDLGSNDMLLYQGLLTSTETAVYWGLATSYEDKKIWFNDASRDNLIEYEVDTEEVNVVMSDITNGLQNLAYDRVTKLLYWTNSNDKTVMAAETSEYRNFAEIWRSDKVSPYGLAIHTTKRKLFFGAYDASSFIDGEITKCDLDGSNPQAIIQFPDVLLPHYLLIDYTNDRLFWTDISLSSTGVIKASDLDGKGTRQFFESREFLLWGLAKYKNFIYITDLVNTTKNEYNIYIRHINGRRGSTVKTKFQPRSIDVYAENEVSNTRVPNECSRANCDHLCFAAANGGFVCKCSPGYTLDRGRRCVSRPLTDDYLLIADIGHKRVFQMRLETSAVLVDSVTALPWDDQTDNRIYAATVDMKNGDFVWADQQNEKIVWGDKTIDADEVSSIVAHCCEEQIYWASNTVIYTWDGNSRSQDLYSIGFFSNDQILQMTLDCVEDRLYWIEYDRLARTAKVLRSDLEGNDIETVLSNIPRAKGITIDYETYTLYIATSLGEIKFYSIPLKLLRDSVPSTDINYPQYSSIDISSTDLQSESVFIWDIRVKNGWVYLADSEASFIRRFGIREGPSSMERYGPAVFYFPSTLDFYDRQHYNKFIKSSCSEETTVPPIEDMTTPEPPNEVTTPIKLPPITPVLPLGIPGGFGLSQNCSAILSWETDDIKLVLNAYLACIFVQIL